MEQKHLLRMTGSCMIFFGAIFSLKYITLYREAIPSGLSPEAERLMRVLFQNDVLRYQVLSAIGVAALVLGVGLLIASFRSNALPKTIYKNGYMPADKPMEPIHDRLSQNIQIEKTLEGKPTILKKKKGNIGIAIVLMFIISLLLFWLPILGSLIAGIVGGRKAGGLGSAMIAVFLPGVVFGLAIFVLASSLTGIPIIGAIAGAGGFVLSLAHIGPLLIGAIIGGLLA